MRSRLLVAALALGVTVVGYNAASAPDFSFPVLMPQVIEITRNAPRSLRETAYEDPAASARININTATAAELESLPGIGEKGAQAIVDYRREHGRFRARRDLMNVKGIGEKTYEKVKDRITI